MQKVYNDCVTIAVSLHHPYLACYVRKVIPMSLNSHSRTLSSSYDLVPAATVQLEPQNHNDNDRHEPPTPRTLPR
eukprot:6201378-Pleurochrysis_carterae.AAC.2